MTHETTATTVTPQKKKKSKQIRVKALLRNACVLIMSDLQFLIFTNMHHSNTLKEKILTTALEWRIETMSPSHSSSKKILPYRQWGCSTFYKPVTDRGSPENLEQPTQRRPTRMLERDYLSGSTGVMHSVEDKG